jgi:DNA-binding CsgD family transcriptional regulator/PAS domain-containing protein
MQKLKTDAEALRRGAFRLGETVIDPALWPDVMQEICNAVGAEGAALLQGDVRTPDVPKTKGVEGLLRTYFREDWHKRDLRADRGVPLLLRGTKVITDQDMITPEEMRRAPLYQECLLPHGFQWFAGIGFSAGAALWGMSIQRTVRQGPFESRETRALAFLSDRLTEVATLSTAVGGTALSNVVNALHLISQAAIAIDRCGNIIEANAAAENMFNEEARIVSRRLVFTDAVARQAFDNFLDRLQLASDLSTLPIDSIVIRRRGRASLVVKVVTVEGAAREPFLGARALLLLTELAPKPAPNVDLLIKAYGLSPAEARLAARVASGISLEDIADELTLALATVRTQIKAVFAKTGTHRQGELVALLARL